MWFTHWLTDEQYSECSALPIACCDLRWLAPWPASTHHWAAIEWPVSDHWDTIESHWAAIEQPLRQAPLSLREMILIKNRECRSSQRFFCLPFQVRTVPIRFLWTLVDSCGFPSIPLWSPQWNSLLMNQCWFRSASCPIRWGTFSERNWIFEIPLHSDRLQI